SVEDLSPANGADGDRGEGCTLRVRDANGTSAMVDAGTVVLATGSRPKPPPAEWTALGAISYDRVYRMDTAERAELCRGKRLVIVGGGNSAMQTAVLLAGLARDTLILA